MPDRVAFVQPRSREQALQSLESVKIMDAVLDARDRLASEKQHA